MFALKHPGTVSVTEPELVKTLFVKNYILYKISLSAYPDIVVQRRYRDFEWLVAALSVGNPTREIPLLPAKQTIGRFEDSFVEDRRRALESFLNDVVADSVLVQSPYLEAFLTGDEDVMQQRRTQSSRMSISSAQAFGSIFSPPTPAFGAWLASSVTGSTKPKAVVLTNTPIDYIHFKVRPADYTGAAVPRTYKDFVWLHDTLAKVYNGLEFPTLPPKQATGRFEEAFVQQRRQELEVYLNELMAHEGLAQAHPLEAFLTANTDAWAEYKTSFFASPEHHHGEQPTTDLIAPTDRLRVQTFLREQKPEALTVTDPKLIEGDSLYGEACISYQVNLDLAPTLTVSRSYNEFSWLADMLHFEMPDVPAPALPKGPETVRFDAEFIDEQRKGMEEFLQAVVMHPVLSHSPHVETFLLGGEDALEVTKAMSFVEAAATMEHFTSDTIVQRSGSPKRNRSRDEVLLAPALRKAREEGGFSSPSSPTTGAVADEEPAEVKMEMGEPSEETVMEPAVVEGNEEHAKEVEAAASIQEHIIFNTIVQRSDSPKRNHSEDEAFLAEAREEGGSTLPPPPPTTTAAVADDEHEVVKMEMEEPSKVSVEEPAALHEETVKVSAVVEGKVEPAPEVKALETTESTREHFTSDTIVQRSGSPKRNRSRDEVLLAPALRKAREEGGFSSPSSTTTGAVADEEPAEVKMEMGEPSEETVKEPAALRENAVKVSAVVEGKVEPMPAKEEGTVEASTRGWDSVRSRIQALNKNKSKYVPKPLLGKKADNIDVKFFGTNRVTLHKNIISSPSAEVPTDAASGEEDTGV